MDTFMNDGSAIKSEHDYVHPMRRLAIAHDVQAGPNSATADLEKRFSACLNLGSSSTSRRNVRKRKEKKRRKREAAARMRQIEAASLHNGGEEQNVKVEGEDNSHLSSEPMAPLRRSLRLQAEPPSYIPPMFSNTELAYIQSKSQTDSSENIDLPSDPDHNRALAEEIRYKNLAVKAQKLQHKWQTKEAHARSAQRQNLKKRVLKSLNDQERAEYEEYVRTRNAKRKANRKAKVEKRLERLTAFKDRNAAERLEQSRQVWNNDVQDLASTLDSGGGDRLVDAEMDAADNNQNTEAIEVPDAFENSNIAESMSSMKESVQTDDCTECLEIMSREMDEMLIDSSLKRIRVFSEHASDFADDGPKIFVSGLFHRFPKHQ